jgi:predicted MFS family arabinose efflux permease
MMVLIVHVAPPIYLNHHAKDRYRNSMQGLFVMLTGSGRLIGSMVAGRLAQQELTHVFLVAAGLAVAAAGLFAFAFRDHTQHDVQP